MEQLMIRLKSGIPSSLTTLTQVFPFLKFILYEMMLGSLVLFDATRIVSGN